MDWLTDLERLFDGAVKSVSEPEVGIVFSAGVDSALVAYTAAKHAKVTAYHVGVEGAEDTKFAKMLEESAPFRIRHVILGQEDVERLVPTVLSLLDEPDPIDVGVGIPFYAASKAAKEDGMDVMLCGQGGDELFGGYWRYLECMLEKGPEAVALWMEKDWENAYEDNLERDIAMNKANGCELRFPYLDRGFSNYARGMPLDLKIREVYGPQFSVSSSQSAVSSPQYSVLTENRKPKTENRELRTENRELRTENRELRTENRELRTENREPNTEDLSSDVIRGRRFIRKYALKMLARRMGVPDYVADRVKKAAQYGSGTNKALDRIARRGGYREKAQQAGRTDYLRLYIEEKKTVH
ncbi:MAG: asparagine synthase-related protein [Candidatus Altiarchaeota archaeon]